MVRVRYSVSPVCHKNYEEKFVHVSFFTYFNQHLPINNIAAHTQVLDLKKSSHTRDTMTLKFFGTMLPSPRIR